MTDSGAHRSVLARRPAQPVRHDIGFIVFSALAILGFVGIPTGLWGFPVLGSVCLAVALLWRAFQMRPVRLVRRGNRILGAIEASELPADRGEVIIDGYLEERETRHGVVHVPCFDIVHRDRTTASVFHGPSSPASARAFAEALCRFGGYGMRWRSPVGGAPEVRAASELDVPLAVRLRRDTNEAAPEPAPSTGSAVVERLPDGSVRVAWPFDRGRTLSQHRSRLLWFTAAAILSAIRFVIKSGGGDPAARLLFLLLPALVLLAYASGLFFIVPEVVASRRGIERRHLLLGSFPLLRARIAADDLESLYVLSPPARVYAASDRRHLCLGPPVSAEEARYLRVVLARAVAGLPEATAKASSRPLVEDGHAPEATPTERASATAPAMCPRCQTLSLEEKKGPLDEWACSSCRGRFLSALGSERLLEQELGISREVLRELAAVVGRRALLCPACGTSMAPIRLKGCDADLCRGCGGTWLDAGELERLSAGRYAG